MSNTAKIKRRNNRRIGTPPTGVMDHPIMRYVWHCCRSRITFTPNTVVALAERFGQTIDPAEAVKYVDQARAARWCEVVQDPRKGQLYDVELNRKVVYVGCA